MEERTGAKRLIALWAKAKAASATALAATALLALSGCGGSDDPEATTASAQSAQAQAETTAPAKPSPGQGQGAQATGTNGKAPQGTASPQGKGKGKKAPPIALPEGAPEPGPTPSERAEATVANIFLSIPGLEASAEGTPSLPATYTCDGKDSWPAIKWQGVPADAGELILFAMAMEPVDGALFFDWAVAGLDPSLEEIQEGKLPQGAITGKNSFGQNGYSVCPPQGKPQTFLFSLYAVPRPLAPKRGFDPAALREQILAQAGNVGLLAASYRR